MQAAEEKGRPRALIIVENDVIPGDRRVWDEAVSLQAAGWDVTILAPHGTRGTRHPDDEQRAGIRVRRFGLASAEEHRLGHLGEYGAALWRIWREVRRLAADRPFDVIQVCNPPDFLFASVLMERRRGTRLIFDQHDLTPEMYESRMGRRGGVFHMGLVAAERLAYRLADVVLATNKSVARIACERGRVPQENVFVVRNGPVLARFAPIAPDPNLARGRRHLLVYVGLMGRQDGVDNALRALAHLRQRRQDWHAAFLGDGEMLPELRALTQALGLDDRVEFRGFVGDEDLRRTVCSADVALAPDPPNPYTHLSTLVKIAEYMALSCPIVSFDLHESRVTAGDAAVYAAGADPEDFARLIDLLLDDPDRRAAMGAAGRARVERELAWEHSERQLLAAYARARATVAG